MPRKDGSSWNSCICVTIGACAVASLAISFLTNSRTGSVVQVVTSSNNAQAVSESLAPATTSAGSTAAAQRKCIPRVAVFHIPKTGASAAIKFLQEFLAKHLGIEKADAQGVSLLDNGIQTETALARGDHREFMKSREGKSPYVLEFHNREARAADVLPVLKKLRFDDGCGVLTASVLREPVSRAVSMMNYAITTNCMKEEARQHQDVLYGNLSDVMARFYTSRKFCTICGEFWKERKSHLCQGEVTEEEQARNREFVAHGFDVVGLTDDLDVFIRQVLRKMDLGLSEEQLEAISVPGYRLTHKQWKDGPNVPSTQKLVGEISPELVNIIKQYGAYDFELYELAKARVARESR
eukprot:TRINITY_DN81841_c0_g1_i1.p1 TRINITY_DN81841_c0_g1~~TRINITY_DN81841_c0_g1_i1.p1  ORF type:complete len:363 (+),score=49.59 TRINITY_DN81841_c0_g1_i1:32-1090(+)